MRGPGWRRARTAACALAGAVLLASASVAGGAVRVRGIAPRAPVLASVAIRTEPGVRAATDAGQAVQPFTTGYEDVITQFLTDVAAASGTATNEYSVAAQYGPSATPDPTRRYQVDFSASDVLRSTDPYPADLPHGNAGGCQAPAAVPVPSDPPYRWCLTDAQIQHELSSVIAADGLPSDLTAIYLVMLPPGVDVCSAPGAEVAGAGDSCSDTDFCGYHSNIASAGGPVYAVIPYAGVSGCESGQTPNGDPAGDSAVSLLSHEHNDAITDPLLGGAGVAGWYGGSTRGEVSDKCAQPYVYGAVASGANYNQTINGHHYYVQDEFANADGTDATFDGCEQRPGAANDGVSSSATALPITYHGGPVLGPHTAYVLFWGPSLNIASSSSTAHVGQTISFTAFDAGGGTPQGPFDWDFGDGTADAGAPPAVSHAFGSPGTQTISVMGAGQSATTSVYVLHGPTVAISAPKSPVHAGATLSFGAAASIDPDGTITTWSWSFGDGTGATGAAADHAYAVPGTYTVSLTESDSSGSSATAATQVSVWGPAAVLVRAGRPALARASGRLVLATARRLGCTTGSAPCSIRVQVHVGKTFVGSLRLTLRNSQSAALVVVLDAAGRRLLGGRAHRTATVLVAAAGGAAFPVRRTFSVRF